MDKFDELFKKALGNSAEPYDPTAWESLSKRLDGQIPSSKNPFKKWGIPGAAAVIGTTAALWYFTTNTPEVTKSQTKQEVLETKAVVAANNPVEPKITEQKSFPVHSQYNPSFIEPIIIESHEPNPYYLTEELIYTDTHNDNVGDEDRGIIQEPKILTVLSPQNDSQVTYDMDLSSLQMPKCLQEEVIIENKNNFQLCIIGPNYSLDIPANSSKKIRFNHPGNYNLYKGVSGRVNNVLINSQTLTSNEPTEVSLEEMNYSSGLPIKTLHIKTEGAIHQIVLDGKNIGKMAKEIDLTVFSNGSHDLKVEVQNENGCISQIKEDFYVSDAYNLLAVNAFDPYSSDTRKNTFMPYALLKRNTPFTMIIIDPSDGGLVFECNDAQNAWDGIDRRTGKMVNTNKAYLWKVSLMQPSIGEKSDYLGTVVRM